MKYERPHLLTLKSAFEMITTVQQIKVPVVVERDPSNPIQSAGAYEADE